MWFLLGIATLIFLCSAFFSPPLEQTGMNILLLYLFLQISFLQTYFLIFILSFFVTLAVFFRSNFDRAFSLQRIFFFSTLQAFLVFVGGIFFAYIILYICAFAHLTSFAIFLKTNPSALGIVTDTKKIEERLENKNSATVIITDGTESQMLFSIVKATSGTDNFYGQHMFAAIPEEIFLFEKKSSIPMVLVDNTLIVSNLKESDLETLSPEIGYLLVKQYFPRRLVKSYPKVKFMQKDDYLAFRKEDAQKKIVNIDRELVKIKGMVSSLSASLEENPKQKRATEKLLSEYQYYENYFESQKENLQGASDHIPNELGVFKTPDLITIVYTPQRKQKMSDYFSMLAHEYLHYASFIDEEKRFASSFFEESLTEYFTRNIIQQSFSAKTNLGYPLQVKILTEITKMYTDSELAEIYFTKDEEALIHALNRVYGDNFYEDNYALFETLQYTSSPEQAIELANIIMAKIGGNKLTEKDLVSSYSK